MRRRKGTGNERFTHINITQFYIYHLSQWSYKKFIVSKTYIGLFYLAFYFSIFWNFHIKRIMECFVSQKRNDMEDNTKEHLFLINHSVPRIFGDLLSGENHPTTRMNRFLYTTFRSIMGWKFMMGSSKILGTFFVVRSNNYAYIVDESVVSTHPIIAENPGHTMVD